MARDATYVELKAVSDAARKTDALDSIDQPLRLSVMTGHAKRFGQLNRRARGAFLRGAVEKWREQNGRPPTPDELARGLQRYPGDQMPKDGTNQGEG